MERNWQGLDLLRGLGLFGLIVMHAAFYYYGGLWQLDLTKPPLIITVVGFLLMFAGLFATISGTVHAMDIWRLAVLKQKSIAAILRKKMITAGFVLIMAYVYFIWTGSALVDFQNQVLNNSILVAWIREGRWTGFNLDRLLYVDSLVMLGLNTGLVSLILLGLHRIRRLQPGAVLTLASLVMALSWLRIPLYSQYVEALTRQDWLKILLLNWLVNKNNPLLPYLAFGLFGAWIGLLLVQSPQPAKNQASADKKVRGTWRQSRWLILGTGLFCLLVGMILYIMLPDTMLQRTIDGKWYSIMLVQLGLFMLMILATVSWLDRPGPGPARPRPPSLVCRFLMRFGTVSLTAFFWESILAALVWRLLTVFWPGLQLGVGAALTYGFGLALGWGLILTIWSRYDYVGSLEWFYTWIVHRLGGHSTKAAKLRKSFPGSQP